MLDQKQPEGEQSTSGNPAFSVRSIARTMWKHKFCITSVWILLSVGVAFVVRKLPALYLAQSLVLVDSQKIPEKFVSATVASDLEDRIAAIREQILSSGELTKIINDFGLYPRERATRFPEEILALMRNDISIDLMPVGSGKSQRPGAFRIGYQGPDPELVARVANRLTDLYVEQNLKTRESQAEGTSEFLDTQLQEAKRRLDNLEASVSAYKVKHNGELPEQEKALTAALSGLHTRLQANMDAINRTQQTKIIQESTLSAMEASEAAEVRALQRPSGRSAAAVMAGAPPPKPVSETLQEQLDTLRVKYTDDHSEVRRLRDALAAAQRSEAQQAEKPASDANAATRQDAAEPVSPELTRTREQIASLRAQITAANTEMVNRGEDQRRILSEIDNYQKRIEFLPVREQEMAQLTRDYEMSKENYKSLLDKQIAAAMALDMERRQQSERFTVLDRAKAPEKPAKPNRPMLYMAGSAGSLVVGVLLGFFLELRRNVFLGEWELPEDTPVLARLPFIAARAQPAAGPPPQGDGTGRKKTYAIASSLLICFSGLLIAGLWFLFGRP